MNKRRAQRLNDVALNILDLAHCLHTGTANEIGFETWRDMFARGKEYEAARKQWQRWKGALEEHDLCERFKDGREDRVVLKPHAVEVAEGLRAKAQAVLGQGEVQRRYPDTVTLAGRTFHLKVYGRAVRPLTDREYAALRESIEAKGRVEVAVVVDRRGNVVDGKHRLIVAAELGLEDVPVKVLDSDDEDHLHDLAEDLNACRRQFTRKQLAELKRQRQERAKAKRAAGMSLRQIAEDEGVTAKTIHQDLAGSTSDAQESVVGKDGRTQPARKASQEETAERRQRVAELLAADEYEELTASDIAETLGVSPRTIQRDLQALAASAEENGPHGEEPDPAPPRPVSFVVADVPVDGAGAWHGVDRETAPLQTCLEAALTGLEDLRQRVDEPELRDLVDSVHGLVESAVWRLVEGAAA